MQKKIHFFLKDSAKIIFILTAIVSVASLGWGAEYPTRPIQVVVAYAPGSTDVNTRPFIEKMPEFLGQPMTFVYKPGAGGVTGASFAAHSTPDGHTLFASSKGPIIFGPLTKQVDYSLDSFAPICRFIYGPGGIVVKADSPIKTFQDLVAAAKASPGKLSYSTAGVRATSHVTMEILCKAAGIRLNHIPTTGDGPAVTALLGGHVDMAVAGMGTLLPHLKTGALRFVAVVEKKRISFCPDVPTAMELGYPVAANNFYSLFGPRDLPKPIIEKIYGSAKKAYEKYKESIDERCRNLGIEPAFIGPEEMDRENRADYEIVKKALKDMEP